MRTVERIAPSKHRILKKIKVAAYARVSSDKDGMLHSLEAQTSYYEEYITRHLGWEFAGIYSDEAQTGTKVDRPAFRQLMEDCRAGKVEHVITKSISRFARNTLTMLEAVRELKDLKVDVYFEKENIHSMSGDGELMLTILASFAQEESRSVSENCKWRIRKKFAEGALVNLRFLYGYRIEKGKLVIYPKEAEIVKRIFKAYLGGKGCTRIARELREEGIKTLKGGLWNFGSIASILKNEKYTGNALLQKRHVPNHLEKKEVPNRGDLPMYYVENSHPPIIDEKTYEEAKKLMEKRRQQQITSGNGKQHPFRSMITCCWCGKKFKRTNSKGKYYWNCTTYLNYGKEMCPSRQIPESILYQITTEIIGQDELNRFTLRKYIKEIRTGENGSLFYAFKDGKVLEKRWFYPSRSDSWNEEKRKKASQKALERLKEEQNRR